MRKTLSDFFLKNQILVALLVVATAWAIVAMREVIVALFVSYIIMSAIFPVVKFLRKKGVPRPLAAALPYIATIAVIVLLIISILPFFISQISLLFSILPGYLNHDVDFFGARVHSAQIGTFATSEIGNIGTNAINVTARVFGGIVSAVSIFAVSFYLLLYRDTVIKSFAGLFPKRHQARVEKTVVLVEDKLGNWLRGQIVLSACIGVLIWVVLTIIGIEFALPLAVLAAMLEIVPTIGPIVSALPAVLVALSISPVMAIIVAVSYFFVQLLENHVLVPRIMQKAVGLNPIVIIIGIIVGGKLLGIPGALLAIPFISLLVVVYKNLE
ncbi:MAG TPA: AI-2E family transporter [Patescibacteria group bacterium]|nr:AI-2E family transporter [Patescibacteria group bacterium]